MDLMGLSTTPYNKINIHVGGVYGDKSSALQRWVDGFKLLDDNTKSRLTIENDDKQSAYTVRDLIFIHENTGIPIVSQSRSIGVMFFGQVEMAISSASLCVIPSG